MAPPNEKPTSAPPRSRLNSMFGWMTGRNKIREEQKRLVYRALSYHPMCDLVRSKSTRNDSEGAHSTESPSSNLPLEHFSGDKVQLNHVFKEIATLLQAECHGGPETIKQAKKVLLMLSIVGQGLPTQTVMMLVSTVVEDGLEKLADAELGSPYSLSTLSSVDWVVKDLAKLMKVNTRVAPSDPPSPALPHEKDTAGFEYDLCDDPLLLFYPLPDDLVIKAKNKQTSAIISCAISDLGLINLSSVGDVDGKPTWKASSSTEGSNSTTPRDKMDPSGTSLTDNPAVESRRDDQSDNTTGSLYSQNPGTLAEGSPVPASLRLADGTLEEPRQDQNNDNEEENYPNIPTGSDTRSSPSSNAPELDSPVSFRPPSFVVEGQSPISISTRGESHYSPTTPRINEDDEDEEGEDGRSTGPGGVAFDTTSSNTGSRRGVLYRMRREGDKIAGTIPMTIQRQCRHLAKGNSFFTSTSTSGASTVSIHSTSTTSRWIGGSSVVPTPSGRTHTEHDSFPHPDWEVMRRTALGAQYPRDVSRNDSDIGPIQPELRHVRVMHRSRVSHTSSSSSSSDMRDEGRRMIESPSTRQSELERGRRT
ncbi:hypothetical protein D9757_005990 [Collybiopsis confluens]|uniref:Uncharacterized protein n=1 Tax=Collybiopsis confluens TaxID=2823264 RepID=A0A8H5HUU4_9AGAR|nr:hypothetical protein D9757_005990 [Collybiopsis confluens]